MAEGKKGIVSKGVAGAIQPVGVLGQSATRMITGVSKVVGAASLALGAAEATAILATGSGALGALTAGTAVAGLPALAVFGGLLLGSMVVQSMSKKIGREFFAPIGGEPLPEKKGFLDSVNPVSGVVNMYQGVGLAGIAVTKTLRNAGAVAMIGTGIIAAAEVTAGLTGIFAFGAASAGALNLAGTAVGVSAATVGIGALPAIAAIGAAGLIAYGAGKGLSDMLRTATQPAAGAAKA